MTPKFSNFLVAMLAGLMGPLLSVPALALDVIVAGAPQPLVKNRDYANLFSTLEQNKIDGFFPTFQYQEIPTPKSFGHEKDFVAPCSPTSRAFSALRNSKVKLVIPAELLYPNPARIGSQDIFDDPLTKLISCAGRENIYGISNYDEALYQGISKNAVIKLYQRVKEIDATLPVIMVHGPLIMDKPQFTSASKRQNYLQGILQYSAYSDIVGFDVYPVPNRIAKLATPLSNGLQLNDDQVIEGYLKWMQQNLPTKRKLMIYQGFGYRDMFEPNFAKQNFSSEIRDAARPPNRREVDHMMQLAVRYNIDAVVWWGQASLRSGSQAPWPHILNLSKTYSGN